MDSPQLAALREEIEELVGKMYSHSTVTHLSGLSGYKCKEHISVTTLERIWGYSTRNASKISVRTLDVIARFVDCDDWIVKDATESLVRAACNYKCDMVITDFYRVIGHVIKHKGHIPVKGPITRRE